MQLGKTGEGSIIVLAGSLSPELGQKGREDEVDKSPRTRQDSKIAVLLVVLNKVRLVHVATMESKHMKESLH